MLARVIITFSQVDIERKGQIFKDRSKTIYITKSETIHAFLKAYFFFLLCYKIVIHTTAYVIFNILYLLYNLQSFFRILRIRTSEPRVTLLKKHPFHQLHQGQTVLRMSSKTCTLETEKNGG